jgi:hypothetical protein
MSITLSQLLEGLYGIKTTNRINPYIDTVSTSATKFLANNPNRVSFIIVNMSANSLYISPLADVSTTKGIFIASNGGYAIFTWDRDFELVSQEWWCIGSAVGTTIYTLENITL